MKELIVALVMGCVGCAQASGADAVGGAPEAASDGHGSSAAEAKGGAKVLARVNGVPITELDLQLRLERDNHEADKGPQHRKNVLEQLVNREILAQKAAEKGLDRDARYQEGLRRLEAQIEAYRRQELSEMLLAREGGRRAPSEEEARAYFSRNEKRIRTQVHVLQILRRSEAAIIEARGTIEGGKDFEEVAKSLFPGLPEGQRPWDLGYLSFQQVPPPWRETVYDMKPGEMSGVLRGPNERYWLVKLVEVREDTSLTFESAREAVLADMAATGQASGRQALEKELRAAAKVEIVGEP